MTDRTRGVLVGLAAGVVLGALGGTVVIAKAQWNTEADQTNQRFLNQQLQLDLYERQSQHTQRDFIPPVQLYRNPC